ncbi:hypothetical protein OPQ81_002319 [Rhizoctonia solani]|nr:hypothetical protein OPQ81_002319 [Rhizoctonia solani]
MSIHAQLNSVPIPPGQAYFRSLRTEPKNENHIEESDLLKCLRNVFAPNQSSATAVRRLLGPSPFPGQGEEELSWNDHTVLWSVGGIPRRTWDFAHEKQDIQWTCWAWFHPDDVISTRSTASHQDSPLDDNPTFGPFFQFLQRQRMNPPHDEHELESPTACRALVVFLRDIAKILMRNGIEHTIHLPFLVRRAWEISPTGLLVQRAQDREELDEAALTGTPLLPTLFSLASPLDEFKIVGCARSILGGFSDSGTPPIVEPLPSVRLHPSDTVVYVSGGADADHERLLVSHNNQKRRLTVWRYASRKPVMSLHGGSAKPRERAGNDRLDRIPLGQDDEDEDPLGRTTSRPVLPQINRSDLSSTMDRIHIGAAMGEGDELTGVGDSSMRPHVWLQHVTQLDLTEHDSNHASEVSIHPFDARHEYSNLAILLPSQTLQILSLTRQHSSLSSRLIGSYSARSASALSITRPGIKDLVFITSEGAIKILLWGLRELQVTVSIPPNFTPSLDSKTYKHKRADSKSMDIAPPDIHLPIALSDPVGSSLTIEFDDGTKGRVSLDLSPHDYLVKLGFEALARVVPADEGWWVRRSWLEMRWGENPDPDKTEFECFGEAVCEVFLGETGKRGSDRGTSAWERLSDTRTHSRMRDESMFTAAGLALPEPDPTSPWALDPIVQVEPKPTSPYLAPAMLALHLAAQTLATDVTKMDRLADIGGLVLKLARRHGEAVSETNHIFTTNDSSLPPDILSHLYTLLAIPHGRNSFPRLTELARTFQLTPALEYGKLDPTERVHLWNDVYNVLCDPAVGDQRARALVAVNLLSESENVVGAIARLPLGVGAPIREALRSCQLNPSTEMSAEGYALIERRDLAHMRSGRASGFTFGEEYEHRAKMDINDDTRPTTDELSREAKTTAQGQAREVSGTDLGLKGFTDVRFGMDRRLSEVEQMLNSSRMVIVKLKERPELSEHDQAAENQQVTFFLAERTFSLAFGRSAYTFGSVPTVMTDVYTIPKIELSVKIYPQNVTVSLEPNRIPPDCKQYADFHNGVAAALRISPSSGSVDSSWIAFNRPNELTAEHAGFLYGLGLTGHLRSMVTWHTFRYLTPKHELTSMGVLLGLAAAHMGSGDKATTKLLCVHIPALLPPRAAELNIPHATQTAAVSGIGLLFLGTRHRRMAEVMLSEIGRHTDGLDAEAYAVSSALAFGMIMVGSGARATSPVDMEMLARLRVYIQGEPLGAPGDKPSFDVNITSPAATIALALMYLRTGREDIAQLLELPDSPMALYRIQPNMLVMRTLGRSLIMWDAIEPSIAWVHGRLPQINGAGGANNTDPSLTESIELAHYHIISGACFAIGLKYAGTADEGAYGTIAYWFDLFTKHVAAPTATYEGQVKRSAVRETLNILSLALAMVMAGTGELTTLRRLRVAYGRYGPGFKFGSPMCTSLALGLLFLGGGRYTLSSSNASIACLIAAFYPRMPLNSGDNRGHLQLLRHLWALAAEPRCLVARDADTGETVYLPVKVKTMAQPPVVHHLMTPTLIPDVRALQSIRVDSPRYWPYYVDVAGVRAHRENILQHQTLFVKRRTGFLSYVEDPRGVRSIFVRAGAHVGDPSALDFPDSAAPRSESAQADLQRFIVSFSNEPMFVAWADRLCRVPSDATRADVARTTYFHQALLECLTADKAQALPLHAGLHALTQTGVHPQQSSLDSSHPNYPYASQRMPLAGHHTAPGPRTLVFRDIRFARDFYSQLFQSFGGRVGEKSRVGLVKGSLLGAVAGAWDGVLREASYDRSQDQASDLTEAGYVGTCAPKASRRSGWKQRERELLRALGLYVTRYSFPGPDTLRGIRMLVEEERAALARSRGAIDLETEHDKLEALKAREGILMLLAANAATGLHGYMPIQDEYHPRWTSDCWEAWGWKPFSVFL